MARTTLVVLTCDLHDDGTEAVTTLTLEANGSRRELDVCQDHLDELLEPARRPRTRAKNRRVSGAAAKNGAKQAAVREWARSNGYTVAARGRVPDEIVAAFKSSKR